MQKNHIPLDILTQFDVVYKHISFDDWADYLAYNTPFVKRRLLCNKPNLWHRYHQVEPASKWINPMMVVYEREYIQSTIIPSLNQHYPGIINALFGLNQTKHYEPETVLNSTKKALIALFNTHGGSVSQFQNPIMKTVSVDLDDLDSEKQALNDSIINSNQRHSNTDDFYTIIGTGKAFFCVFKPMKEVSFGIDFNKSNLIADAPTVQNISFPLNVKRSLNEHLLIELTDYVTLGFKHSGNVCQSGIDSTFVDNSEITTYYYNTIVKS